MSLRGAAFSVIDILCASRVCASVQLFNSVQQISGEEKNTSHPMLFFSTDPLSHKHTCIIYTHSTRPWGFHIVSPWVFHILQMFYCDLALPPLLIHNVSFFSPPFWLNSNVCWKHLCCVLWGVRVSKLTEAAQFSAPMFDTWAMCDTVVSASHGNSFCTTNVLHLSQSACTSEARSIVLLCFLVLDILWIQHLFIMNTHEKEQHCFPYT